MNEFDLYEHFEDLNAKLFDGKLNPITIKWRDTRSRGGLFVCRTVRVTRNGKQFFVKEPQYIEVSSYFATTEDKMRGILAHEMIHQYLAQEDIRDDAAHGIQFHRMLRSLNARNVVTIPFMVDSSDI